MVRLLTEETNCGNDETVAVLKSIWNNLLSSSTIENVLFNVSRVEVPILKFLLNP